MRIILKILFAPIIAVLTIVTLFLNFFVEVSASLLGIIASLAGICGVLYMVFKEFYMGLNILIVAFCISPYGIPRLAIFLVAQLYIFRDWLKEKIYAY